MYSPILSLVLGRQKQRAKNIRFDSDRSNTITCDKFLNLLDYLHSMGSVQGSKLGKENASAIFKVLDGNGDGRLS